MQVRGRKEGRKEEGRKEGRKGAHRWFGRGPRAPTASYERASASSSAAPPTTAPERAGELWGGRGNELRRRGGLQTTHRNCVMIQSHPVSKALGYRAIRCRTRDAPWAATAARACRARAVPCLCPVRHQVWRPGQGCCQWGEPDPRQLPGRPQPAPPDVRPHEEATRPQGYLPWRRRRWRRRRQRAVFVAAWTGLPGVPC